MPYPALTPSASKKPLKPRTKKTTVTKPRSPRDARLEELAEIFNAKLQKFFSQIYEINAPISHTLTCIVANKGYRRRTIYRNTPLSLRDCYAAKTGMIFRFDLLPHSTMGNTQSLLMDGVVEIEVSVAEALKIFTKPNLTAFVHLVAGNEWLGAVTGSIPYPYAKPAPPEPALVLVTPAQKITTLPDWGSW